MIWARQLVAMPKPKLTVFSFGGGVQSTTIMMLLKHRPEVFTDAGLEIPSLAVFADTGAEKPSVLRHIDKLNELGMPIPLRVVRDENHGGLMSQSSRPPWHIVDGSGNKSLSLRTCTDKWKITPLIKEIREEAGYKKGQRVPKGTVHVWIGISTDEIQRAKEATKGGLVNLYPLVEIGWNRNDCIGFLREVLPWDAPKSACYFCPFTRPSEWSRVKREDPELFSMAVDYDRLLSNQVDQKFRGTPFVHPSCIPLDDAVGVYDLHQNRINAGQVPLFEEFDPMDSECSGLCGL